MGDQVVLLEHEPDPTSSQRCPRRHVETGELDPVEQHRSFVGQVETTQMCRAVDFPHPLGPMIASHSPAPTDNDTPRSTRRSTASDRNDFTRPAASTSAATSRSSIRAPDIRQSRRTSTRRRSDLIALRVTEKLRPRRHSPCNRIVAMSAVITVIRPVARGDEEAIDTVVRDAFVAAFGSDGEVQLVRALRDRGELVADLTLVAELDGRWSGSSHSVR